MFKKLVFIGLFLTFANSVLYCQITIIIDDRVEAQTIKLINRKISPTGYRIQICFDTDRIVVERARVKFSNLYPKIATYLTFEAPHYNLNVGDFQTRAEAETIKNSIFGKFTITNIQTAYVRPPQKN